MRVGTRSASGKHKAGIGRPAGGDNGRQHEQATHEVAVAVDVLCQLKAARQGGQTSKQHRNAGPGRPRMVATAW